VLACSAAGNAVSEETTPAVWINPGVYALHFDRSKNLRNENLGLGVEMLVTPDHAISAGIYSNSNRATTRFGAYAWRPLHWKLAGLDVSAGVAIGAFDGYPNYRRGGWFVAPLPLLAIEGRRLGVNLSVIPTIRGRLDGALAVQLKLRVW